MSGQRKKRIGSHRRVSNQNEKSEVDDGFLKTKSIPVTQDHNTEVKTESGSQHEASSEVTGNRRKLGSSRRIKGRRDVKVPIAESCHETNEEVVENTTNNEFLPIKSSKLFPDTKEMESASSQPQYCVDPGLEYKDFINSKNQEKDSNCENKCNEHRSSENKELTEQNRYLREDSRENKIVEKSDATFDEPTVQDEATMKMSTLPTEKMRQEELSQGCQHDSIMPAKHDSGIYLPSISDHSSEFQNPITSDCSEDFLESLISQNENVETDGHERVGEHKLELTDICKLEDIKLKGIDRFDDFQGEDANISQLSHFTLDSVPPTHHQLIDQLISREMPDELNAHSVIDPENTDRDETTELLRHCGNLQASYSESESPIKEETESIKPVTIIGKSTSVEPARLDCIAEQAKFTLPTEKLSTDERLTEHLKLSQDMVADPLDQIHHSEDAVNTHTSASTRKTRKVASTHRNPQDKPKQSMIDETLKELKDSDSQEDIDVEEVVSRGKESEHDIHFKDECNNQSNVTRFTETEESQYERVNPALIKSTSYEKGGHNIESPLMQTHQQDDTAYPNLSISGWQHNLSEKTQTQSGDRHALLHTPPKGNSVSLQEQTNTEIEDSMDIQFVSEEVEVREQFRDPAKEDHETQYMIGSDRISYTESLPAAQNKNVVSDTLIASDIPQKEDIKKESQEPALHVFEQSGICNNTERTTDSTTEENEVTEEALKEKKEVMEKLSMEAAEILQSEKVGTSLITMYKPYVVEEEQKRQDTTEINGQGHEQNQSLGASDLDNTDREEKGISGMDVSKALITGDLDTGALSNCKDVGSPVKFVQDPNVRDSNGNAGNLADCCVELSQQNDVINTEMHTASIVFETSSCSQSQSLSQIPSNNDNDINSDPSVKPEEVPTMEDQDNTKHQALKSEGTPCLNEVHVEIVKSDSSGAEEGDENALTATQQPSHMSEGAQDTKTENSNAAQDSSSAKRIRKMGSTRRNLKTKPKEEELQRKQEVDNEVPETSEKVGDTITAESMTSIVEHKDGETMDSNTAVDMSNQVSFEAEQLKLSVMEPAEILQTEKVETSPITMFKLNDEVKDEQKHEDISEATQQGHEQDQNIDAYKMHTTSAVFETDSCSLSQSLSQIPSNHDDYINSDPNVKPEETQYMQDQDSTKHQALKSEEMSSANEVHIEIVTSDNSGGAQEGDENAQNATQEPSHMSEGAQDTKTENSNAAQDYSSAKRIRKMGSTRRNLKTKPKEEELQRKQEVDNEVPETSEKVGDAITAESMASIVECKDGETMDSNTEVDMSNQVSFEAEQLKLSVMEPAEILQTEKVETSPITMFKPNDEVKDEQKHEDISEATQQGHEQDQNIDAYKMHTTSAVFETDSCSLSQSLSQIPSNNDDYINSDPNVKPEETQYMQDQDSTKHQALKSEEMSSANEVHIEIVTSDNSGGAQEGDENAQNATQEPSNMSEGAQDTKTENSNAAQDYSSAKRIRKMGSTRRNLKTRPKEEELQRKQEVDNEVPETSEKVGDAITAESMASIVECKDGETMDSNTDVDMSNQVSFEAEQLKLSVMEPAEILQTEKVETSLITMYKPNDEITEEQKHQDTTETIGQGHDQDQSVDAYKMHTTSAVFETNNCSLSQSLSQMPSNNDDYINCNPSVKPEEVEAMQDQDSTKHQVLKSEETSGVNELHVEIVTSDNSSGAEKGDENAQTATEEPSNMSEGVHDTIMENNNAVQDSSLANRRRKMGSSRRNHKTKPKEEELQRKQEVDNEVPETSEKVGDTITAESMASIVECKDGETMDSYTAVDMSNQVSFEAEQLKLSVMEPAEILQTEKVETSLITMFKPNDEVKEEQKHQDISEATQQGHEQDQSIDAYKMHTTSSVFETDSCSLSQSLSQIPSNNDDYINSDSNVKSEETQYMQDQDSTKHQALKSEEMSSANVVRIEIVTSDNSGGAEEGDENAQNATQEPSHVSEGAQDTKTENSNAAQDSSSAKRIRKMGSTRRNLKTKPKEEELQRKQEVDNEVPETSEKVGDTITAESMASIVECKDGETMDGNTEVDMSNQVSFEAEQLKLSVMEPAEILQTEKVETSLITMYKPNDEITEEQKHQDTTETIGQGHDQDQSVDAYKMHTTSAVFETNNCSLSQSLSQMPSNNDDYINCNPSVKPEEVEAMQDQDSTKHQVLKSEETSGVNELHVEIVTSDNSSGAEKGDENAQTATEEPSNMSEGVHDTIMENNNAVQDSSLANRRRKMGSSRRNHKTKPKEEELQRKQEVDNEVPETSEKVGDTITAESMASIVECKDGETMDSYTAVDMSNQVSFEAEQLKLSVMEPAEILQTEKVETSLITMFKPNDEVKEEQKHQDISEATQQGHEQDQSIDAYKMHTTSSVFETDSCSLSQSLSQIPSNNDDYINSNPNVKPEETQYMQDQDSTKHQALKSEEMSSANEVHIEIVTSDNSGGAQEGDENAQNATEEPSHVSEGAQDTKTENSNAVQDSSLAKRIRKIGSTRRNLKTKPKEEELQRKQEVDNEVPETSEKVGDAITAESLASIVECKDGETMDSNTAVDMSNQESFEAEQLKLSVMEPAEILQTEKVETSPITMFKPNDEVKEEQKHQDISETTQQGHEQDQNIDAYKMHTTSAVFETDSCSLSQSLSQIPSNNDDYINSDLNVKPEEVQAMQDQDSTKHQVLKSEETSGVNELHVEIVTSDHYSGAEKGDENAQTATEEPNNMSEGVHDTMMENNNAAQDYSSANRRRKMGSTRRNLKTKPKEEELQRKQEVDNEVPETSEKVGDTITAESMTSIVECKDGETMDSNTEVDMSNQVSFEAEQLKLSVMEPAEILQTEKVETSLITMFKPNDEVNEEQKHQDISETIGQGHDQDQSIDTCKMHTTSAVFETDSFSLSQSLSQIPSNNDDYINSDPNVKPEEVEAMQDQDSTKHQVLKSEETSGVNELHVERVTSDNSSRAEKGDENAQTATEEPNNMSEGVHNTVMEKNNAAQDSSSANRRRKMGSTRRNLKTKPKEDELQRKQEDNEVPETSEKVGDTITAESMASIVECKDGETMEGNTEVDMSNQVSFEAEQLKLSVMEPAEILQTEKVETSPITMFKPNDEVKEEQKHQDISDTNGQGHDQDQHIDTYKMHTTSSVFETDSCSLSQSLPQIPSNNDDYINSDPNVKSEEVQAMQGQDSTKHQTLKSEETSSVNKVHVEIVKSDNSGGAEEGDENAQTATQQPSNMSEGAHDTKIENNAAQDSSSVNRRRKMGSSRRNLKTKPKEEELQRKQEVDNEVPETSEKVGDTITAESMTSIVECKDGETMDSYTAVDMSNQESFEAEQLKLSVMEPAEILQTEKVETSLITMFKPNNEVKEEQKHQDISETTAQGHEQNQSIDPYEMHATSSVFETDSCSRSQLLLQIPSKNDDYINSVKPEEVQAMQNQDGTKNQDMKSEETSGVNELHVGIVTSDNSGEVEEEDENAQTATEEPSNMNEGAHDTKIENNNAAQDYSSANRRRKMGSTRRNLRARPKGEELQREQEVDNEVPETSEKAGDAITAESITSMKKELQLKKEHKDGDSEQEKEKIFETVKESSHSNYKSSAHPSVLTTEENHVSNRQLVETEHLTSTSATFSEHQLSLSKLEGRRRKLGSNRKSKGHKHNEDPAECEDKTTGAGDKRNFISNTEEGAIRTSEEHRPESPGPEKTSEAVTSHDESGKRLSSSHNILSTGDHPKSVDSLSQRSSEQVTPIQHPGPDGHLAQETERRHSLGISKGSDLRPNYNVVLVGNSYVGKTSFMKRVESGKFRLDFCSSVGIDTCKKPVTVDGKTMMLQLWDTAGQERFHSITRQVFHKAQAFILMYDITSYQSFSDVHYWVSCIQEGAADNMIILLLGNKSDCAERQVQSHDGEVLAKDYKIDFMECSAATGENVTQSLETVARMLSQKVDTKEEGLVLRREPQQKNSSGCC